MTSPGSGPAPTPGSRPAGRSARAPAGLLLFHGAGGDRNHRLFLELENGLDLPVARVDFPYRRKGPGRRPPDRMPKLVLAIAEAVDEHATAWGVDPAALVLGGRSMGGRAASMAVAEGLPAAGLLLLSYPLHPPGKPEKLRVEHFGDVTCPVLVVQGRRDPFGNESELDVHLRAMAGPVRLEWVDGNHDPKPSNDPAILAAVANWMRELG